MGSHLKLSVLLWVLLFLWTCRLREASDCGRQHIPKGYQRMCSVVNETRGFDYPPEVQLSWIEKDCIDKPLGHTNWDSCPGSVGMELTLNCSVGGLVCKGDHCFNSSIHVIAQLQSEDAGEYACRTSTDVLLAFNVTVDTGAALGVDHDFCGLYFIYSPILQCCSANMPVVIDSTNTLIPRDFYALGTEDVKITVQQNWTTPANYHYHTDLGLVPVRQTISSPYFQIAISNHPLTIDRILDVQVIISVADDSTYESVCIHLEFPNSVPLIYVNQTLPLDVVSDEGSEATFECVLGTYRPASMSVIFGFELYRYSEDNSSVLAWNKTCYTGYNIKPCGNLTDGDQQYHFNYTAIVNVTEFLSIRFTLRISNVLADLNMSSFYCSVLSNDQIQWQRGADLILATRTSPYYFPLKTVVASCVAVLCVIISVITVTVCVLVVLARQKQTRTHPKHLEPEQVPLTDETDAASCDSEVSTPTMTESEDKLKSIASTDFPTVHMVPVM